MDEDTTIINTNTKIEKIKNFLINNKKILISFVTILTIFIISFFIYGEYKSSKTKKISKDFNSITMAYSSETQKITVERLIEIINKKDSTYSPLSLYFIIDNKLISDQVKMNDLFDILIDKTSLENEIKNLIVYKKALYFADSSDEITLLEILKPLINNESIWSSHAHYLLAEYFYFRSEKQKAREFFEKILNLKNANQDIIKESQKRLNRDFSD